MSSQGLPQNLSLQSDSCHRNLSCFNQEEGSTSSYTPQSQPNFTNQTIPCDDMLSTTHVL